MYVCIWNFYLQFSKRVCNYLGIKRDMYCNGSTKRVDTIRKCNWCFKYNVSIRTTQKEYFHVPLNAFIKALRVVREMPLCPFARTLILSASSMRVFSGFSGVPTPAAWDLMRLYCSSLHKGTSHSVILHRNRDVTVEHTSSVNRVTNGYINLFCYL